MRAFTVREVLKAVGGRYFGSESALDAHVTCVSSDSRDIGDGALFVAFKGARVDGHSYMADCLKRGAVCCISEREPEDAAEMPLIRVSSSLAAIGALAGWYRRSFEIPVVGITGSVGKTTTKEMIAAVLERRLRVHKTEKNFNNELGVPRTLLSMPEGTQAAVVEMGISDFGEMTRLTDMVRPNIAVITMIGDAHLEFLHDRPGVLRAKTEIFASMQPDDLAIVNGDDPLLSAYEAPVCRITFGMQEGNDFVARGVKNLGGEGMCFEICHHGQTFEARIPAFGAHLPYAALAGAAVGWALGLNDADIAAGLANYKTVGNRARLIQTGGIAILSDCYNANPNSMASAIDSLATLPGRGVCILGDMLELGENSAALHRSMGVHAAERGIQLVIGCGRLARDIAAGAKAAGANALYFENKEALIQALPEILHAGDKVLVKASHSMAFEQIVAAIEANNA